MVKKNKMISGSDVSILSSGVTIDGNINCDGNVRIDGRVNGNVNVNGNLTLGETSLLNGDIKASNVTLSGKVEGAITSLEKLILQSKAQMFGDLITKILVINSGAIFNGKSKMSRYEKPISDIRNKLDKME